MLWLGASAGSARPGLARGAGRVLLCLLFLLQAFAASAHAAHPAAGVAAIHAHGDPADAGTPLDPGGGAPPCHALGPCQEFLAAAVPSLAHARIAAVVSIAAAAVPPSAATPGLFRPPRSGLRP